MWNVTRAMPGGQPNAGTFALETALGTPVLDIAWVGPTAIVATRADGQVTRWDLTTNTSQQIGAHDRAASCVAVLGDTGMIATGSWDRTVRYWDPRTPKQVAQLEMPERVYALDAGNRFMVVAGAERMVPRQKVGALAARPEPPVTAVRLVDYRTNPSMSKQVETALKAQPRAVAMFKDDRLYVVGGVEGRCVVRGTTDEIDAEVEATVDAQKRPTTRPKNSFAFKCHRFEPERPSAQNPSLVYPVNAIETNPHPACAGDLFATGGGDGVVTLWHKGERKRLHDMRPLEIPYDTSGNGAAVTSMAWGPSGDILATAVGEDYARGYDFQNPQVKRTRISIAWVGERASRVHKK